MQLSHHRQSNSGGGEHLRRHGEHGYILVTFAMLLVPLLLMVGLSVDVGSWYNRASDIQKAADAAALAGVVWLPDEAKASQVARQAAERNGFSTGGDITVVVSSPVSRRLRVTITDRRVRSFIGGNLGVDDIELSRTGSAEYVLPVPLGSPRNFMGTAQLPTGFNENLWLSINTWCTDTVDGDRYQSPFTNTRNPGYSGGIAACQSTYTGSGMNPEYRPEGYEFYVDVPTNRTGNIDLLLYDPMYRPVSPRSLSQPDIALYSGTQEFTYELFSADNTPITDADNPLVPGCSATYTATSPFDGISFLGQSSWIKHCTITTSMPTGKYILRVKNQYGGRYSAGANNFSIVAKYSAAPNTAAGALCDSRSVSTCPRVYGKEAMGVFANQQSSTADFFLAEIDPVHIGKKLEINLFDPGEGGLDIRFRRPTGPNTWTDATFSWSASDGSSGGPTTSLDVRGSRFNGLSVDVFIDLAGYTPPASNHWWQVQYNFGSTRTVTDRTTWSATVIGDPVHLIEE